MWDGDDVGQGCCKPTASLYIRVRTYTCSWRPEPTICPWDSWWYGWCWRCPRSSQEGHFFSLYWPQPPWRGTRVLHRLSPTSRLKKKKKNFFKSLHFLSLVTLNTISKLNFTLTLNFFLISFSFFSLSFCSFLSFSIRCFSLFLCSLKSAILGLWRSLLKTGKENVCFGRDNMYFLSWHISGSHGRHITRSFRFQTKLVYKTKNSSD